MKPRTSITTGAVAALLAAAPARAEEKLDELVVTAGLDSEIPPHFAGSSTVIDAAKIAGSGARSVADLLANEAGIRLSSTSGNASNGQVQMRGFGENASSRVLVLVDGRPMNRPDTAGVSWLEVPLSRIERVEVLRGSQTARFGNNAVGGVINLVTKAPDGKPVTTLEAAGGSDGYQLARLGHRQEISGHDLSFDLEHNFTDGWRDNAASELQSASLRWRKKLGAGNEVRFGVSHADEFGGFPGPLGKARYLADPRQSIYVLAGQGDQYFNEQTTDRADASILLAAGKHGTLEVPLSFSRRDQSWNFGPGSHSDNLLDTFSLTPEFRYEIEGLAFVAGAGYRHDALDLAQFAEMARLHPTADAGLSRDIAGVFTSADWEPWTGWHFQAAARVETARVDASSRSHIDPSEPSLNFSRSGDETNDAFQFGVKWEPDDDTAAWFRYDRLYRLPSTDEIASYQGYPLAVPFNDQLEAETGDAFELGGEWTPGAWSLRANAFLQDLEGEIAYDYLQNLNVNLADTRRQGIELESAYRSRRWELKVHATWTGAEFTGGPYEGKSIYLVPRHQIGAIGALHPCDGLTLQAEWLHVGSAFEGNDFENIREKLPAYAVTNLLVRYEPAPGWMAYARVNNLFDEHYATVKYSGVWYPAAGRQFQVGIRREF